MITILHVNSSGRIGGSGSRKISSAIVQKLCDKYTDAVVIQREAVTDAEFLDETWITANFTAPDDRTQEQTESLKFSQSLADEICVADYIVIGVPVYNFCISGVLKTWIDQICRPGITFRAEPSGFVGLLKNKKAYLAVTSGGTKVNGPIDFATSYMTHILGFIGIVDVTVIAADTMMADPEGALKQAMKQVDKIV